MVIVRWVKKNGEIDPLVHIGDEELSTHMASICGWNFRFARLATTWHGLIAEIVDETPTCLWCVAGVRA